MTSRFFLQTNLKLCKWGRIDLILRAKRPDAVYIVSSQNHIFQSIKNFQIINAAIYVLINYIFFKSRRPYLSGKSTEFVIPANTIFIFIFKFSGFPPPTFCLTFIFCMTYFSEYFNIDCAVIRVADKCECETLWRLRRRLLR